MMTSVTAKLLAIDQRLKALDPQSYNRWLIVPSCVVIALMLIWLLGPALGVLPLRRGDYLWSLSAVFVGFSFVGIGTVWRTKDPLSLKLGLLSLHLCSVALFLAPIGFGVWFISMMSEH
jgi:uncharacterized membrane protein